MPVNPNHVSVNAQEQDANRESVLNFFRALTAFRKSRPAFVYGSTVWLEEGPEALLAYVRELNLSDNPVNLPSSFRQHKVLLSNYGSIQATLGPWEGRMIDLAYE
jgi:oligo-1,6-glucosidase